MCDTGGRPFQDRRSVRLARAPPSARTATYVPTCRPPTPEANSIVEETVTRAGAAPRKTIFVKGNHEDFVWLDSQDREEILPGLFYLRNGRAMNLGKGRAYVRVGGMGGCFGPSDYERHSKHLQGYAKGPLRARRDRRSLSALRDRRAARARRSRGSEFREAPTRSGIRERGSGSRRPHQPRSPAGLLLRSPPHQARRRGRGHALRRTEQGGDARKPRRRGARDPWTRVVAPWRVADAPVGGRYVESRPALTAASMKR
jgi:hypothetical protein